MTNVVAIVQSVFDSAVREINALEQRIADTENRADDLLWEQARQVKAQLDAGLSQRTLAAAWINLRTTAPYSQSHVRNTVAVVTEYLTTQPRPSFRAAYNLIANATRAKPSTPRAAAELFTSQKGIADLRTAVEHVIAEWPSDALGLAASLLHGIAERLESRCTDVVDIAVVEELVTAGVHGLAKQYHPDTGGTHGQMVAVNRAAAWLLARARGAATS